MLVLCSLTLFVGGVLGLLGGWLGWCLFGGFGGWWVSGSMCFRDGSLCFLVFLFVVGRVRQGTSLCGG